MSIVIDRVMMAMYVLRKCEIKKKKYHSWIRINHVSLELRFVCQQFRIFVCCFVMCWEQSHCCFSECKLNTENKLLLYFRLWNRWLVMNCFHIAYFKCSLWILKRHCIFLGRLRPICYWFHIRLDCFLLECIMNSHFVVGVIVKYLCVKFNTTNIKRFVFLMVALLLFFCENVKIQKKKTLVYFVILLNWANKIKTKNVFAWIHSKHDKIKVVQTNVIEQVVHVSQKINNFFFCVHNRNTYFIIIIIRCILCLRYIVW